MCHGARRLRKSRRTWIGYCGELVAAPGEYDPYSALGDGSYSAQASEVGGCLIHVKLANEVDQLAIDFASPVGADLSVCT